MKPLSDMKITNVFAGSTAISSPMFRSTPITDSSCLRRNRSTPFTFQPLAWM